MTPAGQAFLGLTAVVTVLVAIVTFALLKFMTAARDSRGRSRETGMETAFLSAALQDAVTKLKAQERAMALRAETSERVSEEIIANLTAGLLMVNQDGTVQIINPVGRRLLGIGDGPHEGLPYRQVLAGAGTVAALIEECLHTRRAIIRRAVDIAPGKADALHIGLNMFVLFNVGGMLENTYRTLDYLWLLVFTGIATMTTSLFLSDAVSLGASGMVSPARGLSSLLLAEQAVQPPRARNVQTAPHSTVGFVSDPKASWSTTG